MIAKIMPIQKQTRAGQCTRHKAFVTIGDYYGQVARACTTTLGNFAKATINAISKTYSYVTPQPLERDYVHQISLSRIH
ncbi:hypothetical protein A6R68_11760 [Neotoma lepida]|uniref:S5 DRBM domain-containing protein n=1 Tax=Neotoma lepida TaxID=56216 RepID=A0A1A6FU67_NEOLE|nr:hypothetical protein A6R68_11760 [Neotoma lepida]